MSRARTVLQAVVVLTIAGSVHARPDCPGSFPESYTLTVVPQAWPPSSPGKPEVDPDMQAYDINIHGAIAGVVAGNTPFAYSAERGPWLLNGDPYPYFNGGHAYAINDLGWIVGTRGSEPDYYPTVYPPDGDPISYAINETYAGGSIRAINNSLNGACTRFWRDITGLFGPYPYYMRNVSVEEFRHVPGACGGSGGVAEWTDINNLGRIVGVAYVCDSQSQGLRAGFSDLTEDGTTEMTAIPPLPGHTDNRASSVNDHNVIVGNSNWNSGRPFIRTTDGVVTPLGSVPGQTAESYAWCIGNAGEVVGSTRKNLTGIGWRWTPDSGMVDLNLLLDPPNPNYVIVEARGVNAVGQIAATARELSTGKLRAVILQPQLGSGCPADWNCDTTVTSADFFAFLTAFFENNADFNDDGSTTSADFFDFLAAFFTGC